MLASTTSPRARRLGSREMKGLSRGPVTCHILPLSAARRVPISTASLATDRNLRPALDLSPRVRVYSCGPRRRSFSPSTIFEDGTQQHQPAHTWVLAPYACRFFRETPIKAIIARGRLQRRMIRCRTNSGQPGRSCFRTPRKRGCGASIHCTLPPDLMQCSDFHAGIAQGATVTKASGAALIVTAFSRQAGGKV